jgi:hypothetical protein
MRRAGETPQNEVVDIVTGEVTSSSPLKVKVENRELTESFLILGALCKETHIYTDNIKKYNHTHSGGPLPSAGDFDILLWRGLQAGDKVLMLKVGKGQKYYVIQREEGVIP